MTYDEAEKILFEIWPDGVYDDAEWIDEMIEWIRECGSKEEFLKQRRER